MTTAIITTARPDAREAQKATVSARTRPTAATAVTPTTERKPTARPAAARSPHTKVWRFLTFWAFLCHFLFLVGVLPNTYALAVAVFVLSRAHILFDRPIPWAIDFVFHWLPLIVVPPTEWNWLLAAVVVGMYLVVVDGPLEAMRFHAAADRYFYA